jgi:hypothetical protein
MNLHEIESNRGNCAKKDGAPNPLMGSHVGGIAIYAPNPGT